MNKSRYECYYEKISAWFQKEKYRYRILRLAYICIPIVVAVLYVSLIIYAFLRMQRIDLEKILAVPAVTFVMISFLRKWVDRPRPYVKYRIEPLIVKKKTGESFPSRHTLSVAIIAMAWMYTDWRMGLLLWGLTVITATVRVFSGVHFVSDVIAAMLFAFCFGAIGFWVNLL
jgi:membrane-associated phospholipid phosphatase